MHLSDYMAKNRLKDAEVAAAIGRSRVSVSRYRRRLIRPEFEIIEAVKEFSNGKVKFEDWRGQPEPAKVPNRKRAA